MAIQPSTAAAANLVRNSDFTDGTVGWKLSSAGQLLHVTAASGGTDRVLVAANGSGGSASVAVNDSENAVASTVAGRRYTVSAQVMVNEQGQGVALRAQEWGKPGSQWELADESAASATPTPGQWTKLTFDYVAKETGFSIDINVIAEDLPAGREIVVDDVSVKDTSGAEYVHNGSFDDGTTGWYLRTAGTLSTREVGSAQAGGFARLHNNTSSSTTVVLNDEENTVTETVKGRSYTAQARVRSPQGSATVELRLQEWSNSNGSWTKAGEAKNSLELDDDAWTLISVTLTAATTGSTVDLNLLARSLTPGGDVDVDDVQVTDSGSTDSGSSSGSGSGTETTDPPPSGSGSLTGWRLAYSDEFSGTGVKSGDWEAYYNSYGDGNDELACLTPDNVSVGSGTLKIVGKKQRVSCPGSGTRDYTSGFLGSREVGKYYPLFGRYEMRARLPHGQGVWPGFWLRHRNGAGTAEVDVMEYFYSQVPGKATHSLHFGSSIGRNVSKRSTFFEKPVVGTGGWHTFAVEILPEGENIRFRFFIDGTETLTYLNTNHAKWSNVDKQHAWDIALNMAVGSWGGHPSKQLGYLSGINKCSLTYQTPPGGNPANCPTTGLFYTPLPATYEVDYVRVYVPS